MSATIALVGGITFFVLHPERLVALLGGIVTAIGYLWYASVRAVPGVRRRKAAAREAWRSRPRRPPDAA
jgi:hypothetical protein